MFRWKNKQLNAMDRAKVFRNLSTYIILGMALFAIAFFGVCNPRTSRFSQYYAPQGTAASIGSYDISGKDFRRVYTMESERWRKQYGEKFNPAEMQLAQRVLNQMVDQRALSAAAQSAGLDAVDNEVLKEIREFDFFKDKDGAFSEQKFADFIKYEGFTEVGFYDEIRRSIMLQKLEQFLANTTYTSTKAASLDYRVSETKVDVEYLKFSQQDVKLTVSQDEIKKFLTEDATKNKADEYFKNSNAEFSKPEKVHARHILIAFKGARNAPTDVNNVKGRTKTEAKKRAAEVLEKVKKPGSDFVAIATSMTDEPSGKTKGGDLGFFTKDSMVKEFSDVAFSMKPGEISNVVESPFGFHIIKVEAHQDAVNKTFDQVKEDISKKLIEKERLPAIVKERSDKVLTALNKGENIDELLKEYGISWKATGPFAINTSFIPGIGSEKNIKEAILKLRKIGIHHDKVLEKGESAFIVRLKSREEPDLSKLDSDKLLSLSRSKTMMQVYARINAIKDDTRKTYEKKGRIWFNPAYLALDDRQRGEAAAPLEDVNSD